MYNSADLSAAEGILRGSFQQFEWLIINDGSTNATTLALLQRWRQVQDPRVRYFDLPVNTGLSAARNFGARHARGELLLFADADDIFEPTYIEKCVLFLTFHSHHAVCSAWSYGFGAQEYVWDSPGFGNNGANLHTNSLMSMSLLRRSAYQSGGGLRREYKGWHGRLGFLAASPV